jgi:hypothetical protein
MKFTKDKTRPMGASNSPNPVTLESDQACTYSQSSGESCFATFVEGHNLFDHTTTDELGSGWL